MIKNNWKSVAGWFFGLLFVFWMGTVWTTPVYAAVTIIFIALYGDRILTIAGKTVAAGWLAVTFLGGFFVSLATIDAIIGVRIGDLHNKLAARSVAVLLVNPEYLGPRSAEILAALLLSAIIAGGYVRSDDRDRYHRVAAIYCIIVLVYSGISSYAPGNSSIASLVRSSFTNLRGAMTALTASKVGGAADSLNVRLKFGELQKGVPPTAVVVTATALLEGSTETLHEGQKLKAGTVLFILVQDKQEIIYGLPYVHVQLFNEPEVNGYVRVDALQLGTAPSLQSPSRVVPVVMSAPPSTPASFPTPTPSKVKTLGLQEESEPGHTIHKVNQEVLEDSVTVSAARWADSRIIPRAGDVLEFGPFESEEDARRLMTRTGNLPIDRFIPDEPYEGVWMVHADCIGGPNLENHHLRLKVERGSPLMVKIKLKKGREVGS